MKRLFPVVIIIIALFLLVIGSCSQEEVIVYEFTSDTYPIEGWIINPKQGKFDSGEQVTISAISSNGYYFLDNICLPVHRR